ncbi:hypothetical protein [Haliscomenobacter hydrossis]|uniref:Alkyl hydroperoxide reductase subunit C/ Thiol specific antioxidant domain-containing protein n=1 Tax=Haliscomenobacter hydrossis (strain ATCC 27775 / DSM 1100 / LMG 10767 / O) TaxID=760192 RepID=F4L340_HALH1|nr:hypothetical protein [Haliscomenobacter hydrossis]AEE50699.1 hypothetical protein Halhy_2833 [Haliscomenobacter hydrossis DSM 1100]
MKKTRTSLLLVCITGINLLFFTLGLKNSKSNKRIPVASTQMTEIKTLKEIINLDQAAWNDENKKIQIDDILREKTRSSARPCLVIRFSFRNCDLCTKNVFDNIVPICNALNLKYDHIQLLGTFLSDRDSLLFQNRKQLPYHLNTVPENALGLQLEQDASYPFFFVLFPDGTARHVFIPIKEDVERTRRYLDIIRQKYFSDDQ